MVKNQQDDLFASDLNLANGQLSDEQKLCWLRLIRSNNIGPITFRDLINHFGSAQAALTNLERGGVNGLARKIISQEEALREMELASRFGAQLVARGELGYPQWLQTIDAAPPLIYVKGQTSLVDKNIIAIVGSRNASAAGRKFAAMLARDLGNHGFAIVSGLARGIDTEVHNASLETGTIAVLGGGIDHIYPERNEQLYHKISGEGLLVSERPMGHYAKAKDFPRRNRIISGMAIGTIVVEAATRSGSLITARFANEQGREVFAVPGNPLDPRALGTNKLIQDGAMLITSAQDVIDAVSNDLNLRPKTFEEGAHFLSDTVLDHDDGLDEDASLKEFIIGLLGPTPVDRDELCRQAKCSARQIQIILLDLDLEGRLEHHGGQLISLRP